MLRPAFIAPLLCLIYVLAVVNVYDDALAIVTIGSEFAPEELENNEYTEKGYDGQFVYYLARYGIDSEAYIDVPSYRAQRILLPVLGRIVSFGQDSLLVWALLLVNLIALGGGTVLLEKLLVEHKANRWIALGFALSLGMFGAARLITTETLAYALALGGIYLMRHNRWRWAAVIFALSVLSKEMTLFFPAAYGVYLLYQRKIPQAFIFGAIVLLPFIIWQGILYNAFGSFGIGSGGAGTTGFAIVPFMGFIRLIIEPIRAGNTSAAIVLGLLMGMFVMLPTVWALWQVVADTRYTLQVRAGNKPESTIRGWSLMTWHLLTNIVIIPFVPLSTFAEPLGMLRFIVGMQIMVILYAAARRKKRALSYSTFWFVTSFLVIVSDFAAVS
ncbi:MAG: hypothetical protein Q9P01_04610 [Anaerolineae bacterium]|nr:hypothetical protein [Anaerolineae bacterium]